MLSFFPAVGLYLGYAWAKWILNVYGFLIILTDIILSIISRGEIEHYLAGFIVEASIILLCVLMMIVLHCRATRDWLLLAAHMRSAEHRMDTNQRG